ncbi:MAG TPA: PH domain-containing protein [Candidatus Saccharibacteria bacterium]|nr:PH domain-containing protein [Candidatus Saccharibacteria bacterium]
MAKKPKDKQNKPEKQFDDQFDDEEVLFVFRKHPVVMRKGLIFSMLAILAGTIPSLIKPEMSYFFLGLAGGFAIGFLIFMPYWISWYYSVYIVTDQRLIQISRKGLFSKTVVDMSLNQIQSMNYSVTGLQETLLKFGTIVIQTYIGDLVIHDVHHPEHVQKTLATILRDQGISTKNFIQNNEEEEQK